MKPLTTPELLQVWEYGLEHPLLESTTYLLNTASLPGEASAVGLTIGQRDIRLLQLHEWFFGSKLSNISVCPVCAQQVEWENEISDFRLQPLLTLENTTELELSVDGFDISFRLPSIKDMQFLRYANTPEENARVLLIRCLLQVQKNGEVIDPALLPSAVLNIIEEYMAKEDPQADINLLLDCPACSHQWEVRFDIQRYLWAEVNAWAKNILQEVYILAKHFSWSERDILAMKPQRRQLYLEMIFA